MGAYPHRHSEKKKSLKNPCYLTKKFELQNITSNPSTD